MNVKEEERLFLSIFFALILHVAVILLFSLVKEIPEIPEGVGSVYMEIESSYPIELVSTYVEPEEIIEESPLEPVEIPEELEIEEIEEEVVDVLPVEETEEERIEETNEEIFSPEVVLVPEEPLVIPPETVIVNETAEAPLVDEPVFVVPQASLRADIYGEIEENREDAPVFVRPERTGLTDESLNPEFQAGQEEIVLAPQTEEDLSSDQDSLQGLNSLNQPDEETSLIDLLDTTMNSSAEGGSQSVLEESLSQNEGMDLPEGIELEGEVGNRRIQQADLPTRLEGLVARLTVSFRIVVTESGLVKGAPVVVVSSGSSEIDNAISRALREWKFNSVSGGGDVTGVVNIVLRPR